MNQNKWINLSLKILFLLAIAPPTYGKITQNEQFLDDFTGSGAHIGIYCYPYARFTFSLTGAFASHLLAGEPIVQAIWALFTLALLMGAYHSEEDKKLSAQ